ncbi:MAG: Two component transcriptional regulator, winged helix family [Candidatus Woesebacteria bacterium GW2011_GWF2_46_8]|uniref:Two component transcriptional regulator, winged helix family n=1 Tax=Candidatus Woesebacteria bacterium GW2011_GWF2_46_8 TaxID=1618604 RepID=A0A0G1TVD2_9BACT|nr:MAG: Two component transcriptional regulator, winged helix family [Candidatus Woesebacteria bacterium GW2011_GWF2_46_8]
MRILLVEDDPKILDDLARLLTENGYVVDKQSTLEGAIDQATSSEHDCIVLDRGLPDGDGLELVKTLQEEDIKTPVLVLTAKNSAKELVKGLDIGADDYLGKPFGIDELLARIRGLIRRGGSDKTLPVLSALDLELDTNTTTVKRAGKMIALSPKEYAMLHYLLVNKNRTIDRIDLLTHVWGDEIDLFSNTVDVHVRYLRRKIDDKHAKKLIRTVRGKGYMLCE